MPRKFERIAILLVLITAPLWLSVLPSSFTGKIRMTLAGALTPVFSGIQATRQGLQALSWGVLRGVELREENKTLQAELQALRAREETQRQLFAENARLRDLVRFRAKSPWKLIPAEVIGRELGPWSRTLLLDQGNRHGIRRGMAVITPVGLVGRISEVGSRSARVTLITDASFRVTGTLTKQKVSGLVQGVGSGECIMTYLPLDVEVAPKEPVLTTGGKSFCPDGIPVGFAGRVRPEPARLYQSVRIRPAANLSSVEEVLVIAWPHPDSGS